MTLRILVVDDNELNLELISDVLTAAGYRVEPARSGQEALSAARRLLPDLILLDIGLPDMNGYTVVRELKSDPRTWLIPTVAVTALAMAGDAERAAQSGFDGYITKPIATRTLPETLAGFLARRGHQ